MSDLISRNEMLRTYQELCMNIACSECSFYFGDTLTGDCLLEKWIHSLPSAEPKTTSNGSITSINPENTHDRTMGDLISRQEATTIPVMPVEYREYQTMNLDDAYEQGWFDLQKCIEELPYAEPETKPISYMDCANAMLKMWIDNVLIDGEYKRIMDKLNAHERKEE